VVREASKPTISPDPGSGQFSLACGCAGRCSILHIERFAPFQDESAGWYFDFFTRRGERSSLGWRIKLAWKVLIGRDHFCEATMWSDEEIEGLRRFLNGYVPIRYAPTTSSTLDPPRNTNG
jgi:hypothetical protein